LQGFNINSASSLNNIIAIINKEFGLTFPNFFTDNYYQKTVRSSSTENSPELLKYINKIRCVFHPRVSSDEVGKTKELKENWFGIFKEILEEKGENYTQVKAEIFGVGFKIYGRSGKGTSLYPEIFIDPLSLNNVWHILTQFNDKIYEPKHDNIYLSVSLKHPYNLPDDHFLISSRLINTEVSFDTKLPNVVYKYRNIMFRVNITTKQVSSELIQQNKELVLIVEQNNKEQIPLLSLVKLLEYQMVINKR
jgi:hypothetical protein